MKKWIRYKDKFSSGINQKWSYREIEEYSDITKEDTLNYYLESICDRYSHSEHYRGIDYEVITEDNVSIEFLEKNRERIMSSINNLHKELEEFKEIIKRRTLIDDWKKKISGVK
jgi:hypothetical protein